MHALKIETASIQKYIFSSNKLKVNLGASYIVEHLLFKQVLSEAVGENHKNCISEWYEAKSPENLSANEELRVGYIGGGNAVLYGNEGNLKEIDQQFKAKVLEYFPGLEVYSAIIKQGDEKYKNLNKKLSDEVNANRSARPFINRTFHHGFFNSCHISGGAAQLTQKESNDNFVSDDVKVKYNAMPYVNEQHITDLLSKEHIESYTFPLEFEKLSSKDDKAYIAVVHIDGNNMGQSFIDAEKIEETQKLSIATRNIATNAYQSLLSNLITKQIKDGKIGDLQLKNEDGKTFLPIRPIITGGDDITFVCEGTLGISLAKQFLKEFTEKSKGSLFGTLYACAGVSIVKQKYPFSKAYQLSEELIQVGKKLTRGKGNNGSYLAALVAGYGTGSSLADLKMKYARPEFLARPYYIEGEKQRSEAQMSEVEHIIQNLKGEDGNSTFPRNKLMELRFSILKGKDETEKTWKMIHSRYSDLKISNWDMDKWYEDGKKRVLLFEAIEWLDFYQELNN